LSALVPAASRVRPLPILGLLALSTASFLTILTEALPAGLLPQIGSGLGITEAMAGQLITVYAIGSFLAAIPLIAVTRSLRRRPLLLSAIVGFLLANTVTALAESYTVILAARFVGGVAAGLLWALMAGYAVKMAPPGMEGRALTIALAGTPVALSIGIPAATYVGLAFGWRASFWLMSLISVCLLGWVVWKVPDFAGEAKGGARPSLRDVFLLPGVRPALFVVVAFVLSHNILYTYIAPLLTALGTHGQTDRVLLVFGVVALASIFIVGSMIDRWLRPLLVVGLCLFPCGNPYPWVGAGFPGAGLSCSGRVGTRLRWLQPIDPDRRIAVCREGGRRGDLHDRHAVEHWHCRWRTPWWRAA
jgi:predicted MFS family arabinose efflux permease